MGITMLLRCLMAYGELGLARLGLVWAVVAAALAFSPAAQAELIVNGSFESTRLAPSGNFKVLQTGSSFLTGWTVGGKSVDVLGPGNPYIAGAAAHGDQYLDLVGSPGPGSISQILDTVAGQKYVLSFEFANNYNAGNGVISDMSQALVEVAGNSTLLSEIIEHSGSEADDLKWATAIFYFTADSDKTTLTFSSYGPGSNGYSGILLDNVSVVPLTTPEPASLLVWSLVGTAGVAWRMRKKKQLSR